MSSRLVLVFAPRRDRRSQIAVKYGSRQHHRRFGDMRPVEGLTLDNVAHITAYVRAEQRKAGIR